MSRRSPLPWLGAVLAAYLLLPLVALATLVAGGTSGSFGAPGLLSALGVSTVSATLTTLCCALFGIPLALALARSSGVAARVVGAVVMLPLALPPLMAGILLVAVLGPHTLLGRLAGGRLTDSLAGIVLAQAFVAAPFTVIASRSAFAAVDGALLDVAATSGCGSWRRLTHIWLPAAGRGVAAGLLLTWLRAFGEFGATVVVAYHPTSLPVLAYVRFGAAGLDEATGPTVLALVVGVAVLVVATARPRRRRAAHASPAGRAGPSAGAGAPGPLTGRRGAARAEAPALAVRVAHRVGGFDVAFAYAARSAHLALVGPSGAGKSTALRCLAGLAGPSGSSHHFGTVGYVPQEPSLVPGRTVWQQVTLRPGTDRALAYEWCRTLGLVELLGRLPGELSGGQARRVALARALAGDPGLLLLDEPFAGLDAPVRAEVRRTLRSELRKGNSASVVVTHDAEEAALLADELLVLEAGRLAQAGPSAAVLARPATPAVARLLGMANVHRGRLSGDGALRSGALSLAMPRFTGPAGGVHWGIRAEHISVAPVGAGGPASHLGVVEDAVALGVAAELMLSVSSVRLVARTDAARAWVAGTPCAVTIPSEHVRVWPDGASDRDADRTMAMRAMGVVAPR